MRVEMTDTRPCTCAPDERPYPCQHQYALGLCRKAEIRSLRAELDRCIAQIGDLARLRSEEEVTHGHVMGRIAIALFREYNNRTDEECVAKVAEVVYERDNLRQHLHDEHQRHVGTMDERDALAADAARYRWLREGHRGCYNNVMIYAGNSLDAAIDAAMMGASDEQAE